MGRRAPLLAISAIGCITAACAGGGDPVLRHETENSRAIVRYDLPLYSPEELAAIFVGRTVLVHDGVNGNEVTYFAEGGIARLWHPTQRDVVRGGWRLQGRELCVRFGTRGFNPITMQSASTYSCEPLARFQQRIVSSQVGDVFGLSDGRPPGKLRRRPTYSAIEALAAEGKE